jgi:hypothetical protein
MSSRIESIGVIASGPVCLTQISHHLKYRLHIHMCICVHNQTQQFGSSNFLSSTEDRLKFMHVKFPYDFFQKIYQVPKSRGMKTFYFNKKHLLNKSSLISQKSSSYANLETCFLNFSEKILQLY